MNECVIATGNHFILIRCAEHRPYTSYTFSPIVCAMFHAAPEGGFCCYFHRPSGYRPWAVMDLRASTTTGLSAA